MNVQSPPWASFFPKSREPLSSGLRSAYATHETLPPDIETLLNRARFQPPRSALRRGH